MSSRLFQITEHTIPCQHIREYPAATRHRQEDALNLAIKHYSPLDNLEPKEGDVTIIGTHGNGFPKEVYEPLWDELLSLSRKNGFKIRSIWVADASHQGASGVLNEGSQGDDPSWFDHSRDLLHMINHFRDDMPRPMVGLGHSMGGAQLVNLSIIHPRLLSTLILIEPVILAAAPAGPNAALPATYRPDLWPSRVKAESAFRGNKFFQKWDRRVLDNFLKYGLRKVPTAVYPLSSTVPEGGMTLTTTKHQEAWSYLRPRFEPQASDGGGDLATERTLFPDQDPKIDSALLFYRPEPAITLRNLPFLRPSVLYIFGQRSFLSPTKLQDEKVSLTGTGIGGSGGTKEGRVKKVVIEKAGHLVPLEEVGTCAAFAAEWLGKWYHQWTAEEEALKLQRNRKSERGMLVVSDEWKKLVRNDGSATRPVKEKL